MLYFQLKDDTYHIEKFRNTYAFFAGECNEGEDTRQALEREMFEELEPDAARLIFDNAKYFLTHKKILDHGPRKGDLQEFSLFESILDEEVLLRISKYPIKEGEGGSLIRRGDIPNIKFNGTGEIVMEYINLIS